ncbi:MAG TPA: hypothetical protein P5065_06710 [Candidatus Ratteibacteria bacterium]|nr:hypothetical protein [Candidatus Ratteibacteria bacterium]
MKDEKSIRKNFNVIDSDFLVCSVDKGEIGFAPQEIWSPSPSVEHRTKPYKVPRELEVGIRSTREVSAKFSPPPFAVIIKGKDRKIFVGICAEKNWHLWNFAFFKATRTDISVRIDLEGHSNPDDVAKHVNLVIVYGYNGESDHHLLSRGLNLTYPDGGIHPQGKIPSWWLMPIYCGYGDQVGIMFEFEGGKGPECRALAYCIQGLYERWINILDEENIPFGTIIIDAGWSSGGNWVPNKIQWPDLRGFIDRQHKKGRKVLLWIATWFTEGIPDEWCIFAGDRKLVVDPENYSYILFLRENVHRLLSPEKGCYNADGFKIDQLSYVPTEREPIGGEHFGRPVILGNQHDRIEHKGLLWGCELLYKLQKEIYSAAKNAKKDCLITSSTVHPYFHDTFDMVRLHDAGVILPETDVLTAMKARSDLAKAALPSHPIDSDNWVHSYYEKWLDFTMKSYSIGVPCIFYAERFVCFRPVPKVLPIKKKDLRLIAQAWKKYIRNL